MGTVDAELIDLAHTPDFQLGRLSVRPAVRQLIRDDGEEEVLEPRVMQVLLALVRAQGGIVTRDELTSSCWEGRVVGEDAINRVISRLRRSAEGVGAGSFRIETITKVGYRILSGAGGGTAMPALAASAAAKQPMSRRTLIGFGSAAVAVAAGAGVVVWDRLSHRTPPPNPRAAQLLQEAMLALRQDTHDGQNQAVGMLREAVALQPDYADGWGALAMCYGIVAHYRSSAEAASMRDRARAAAERAVSIDPDNALAAVARASNVPVHGHWLRVETAIRRALTRHPGNPEMLYSLAGVLSSVGRSRECAALFERVRQADPPNPGIYFRVIISLWSADRLDDADRMIAEASSIYPSQFSIWFARLYILMYSNRAAQAMAMLDDSDNRPTGIPVEEFEKVRIVVSALETRTQVDIDRAMQIWLERSHQGAGYAENTVQFACALGRIDTAFAVAEAYYFNRGFPVPELRFNQTQGSYTPIAERLTSFLFNPCLAPMRADPRFAKLTAELGLEAYWRDAHVQPDYRKS